MNITPANVELVRYSDIVLGDTLVHFTAANKNITVAPTERQLRAKRTRYATVATITTATTSYGVDILDLNGGAVINPTTGASALPAAFVWRVKR